MNAAHVHLMINHVSLIAIPTALIFLTAGFKRRDDLLRKLALWVILASSLFVIPTYLSGESAADILFKYGEIKNETINEHALEEHEEAAETSRNILLVLATAAAIALYLQRHKAWRDKSIQVVILLALISLTSLGYASLLGGKIRHPEENFNPDNPSAVLAPQDAQSDEPDEHHEH